MFGECQVKMDAQCLVIGEWTKDPFAEEIHAEEHWMFICENCYQGLCYEI